MSVNKIDNIAESKIREQRTALREQIDPILNNTMAQLYNGEVPDAMPDKASIMFAYGEQGAKAVKQLDIAINNAKTFQAIQYVSPEQQQAEIAKLNLRQMTQIMRSSSMRMASSARWCRKAMKRYRRSVIPVVLTKRCLWGEKLDPTNKSMQKAPTPRKRRKTSGLTSHHP
ncbi:Lytic transglycosylase, catalytic [Enterobacter asburiae]|uniref:Lytic transglycosylase, catalytic n=1 Tax=Enterobacter asburiae TaxID=61645 RepID=A0A376F586_ENTAS|nr:Lytic transglycosylase, catalytic [Enterobacter asburiae]